MTLSWSFASEWLFLNGCWTLGSSPLSYGRVGEGELRNTLNVIRRERACTSNVILSYLRCWQNGQVASIFYLLNVRALDSFINQDCFEILYSNFGPEKSLKLIRRLIHWSCWERLCNFDFVFKYENARDKIFFTCKRWTNNLSILFIIYWYSIN